MNIARRLFAVGAVAAIGLAVTASANAYTITTQGQLTTDSTFNAVVDLTGQFSVAGAGAVYDSKAKKVTPFAVTGVGVDGNPAPPGDPSAPLSLFGGPTNISSTPTDLNGGALYTLTEPNLKTLTDVQNLDVDLLNGQTGGFTLNTLDIYTNSTVNLIKDITIDLTGELSGLTFTETGATVFVPTGVGTGTFSILGDLSATISNLNVTALGIIQVPVDPQSLTTPFALTGTYTISTIPGGRHISLDGSVDLAVPLSVQTNLTTSLTSPAALSVSTTIDLLASLTVSVGYHLETNVVPEPGSFILLGLGLASLIPVFGMRRKK